MKTQIKTAFISIFSKDGIDPIIRELNKKNIAIFSTGGTYDYIISLGIPCTLAEDITGYPSILGGRVKTLHPAVFGGILARRDNQQDLQEIEEYKIPLFDLVIVDLYPFENTIKSTADETQIIEKIDIGGVSLIRAAAKNFNHVAIVGSFHQYPYILDILQNHYAELSLEQRKHLATAAFSVCANYDIAIANWFGQSDENFQYLFETYQGKTTLRYGENPHQNGTFYGDLSANFTQIHGKEISYNNLVDIDSAFDLIHDFHDLTFAIIKHANVCGIASRDTLLESWNAALAGDPESAFGGILITNAAIDENVAFEIDKIFFEVIIAPSYSDSALKILQSKKNRIILISKNTHLKKNQSKHLLNGMIVQDLDETNFDTWLEKGARPATDSEKEDLIFANLVCKHLKSNAITIVKNKQLLGKGAGQTSRIDALRQAIQKAQQFNFDLFQSVLASDAFFPFSDCIELAHSAGISAIIEPGGSIRDDETINFALSHDMALVLTSQRHFYH